MFTLFCCLLEIPKRRRLNAHIAHGECFQWKHYGSFGQSNISLKGIYNVEQTYVRKKELRLAITFSYATSDFELIIAIFLPTTLIYRMLTTF